ncbi:energy transducer TonB [Rhodanobacter sp. C01]|uniref:energy transducer TonB n=1 Tax=Rhodanobacter sp. C01 TaxID=1945856 RepID=UPI000986F7BF|nr:energy transducer TonB [Rhodanobacter sp. C01]OOG51293.1 hypothetical protein B0E50_00840 [Rhodanobacter sp. C01]
MKRILLGLFCVLLSGVVMADEPSAVRKSVQASMLVSGTVEVATDGSVTHYTLDHPKALPKVVTGLLAQAVPAWRFRPVMVDGKPAAAKAPMSLRVVAKPQGDGNYSVSVVAVWFGDGVKNQSEVSAETISYKTRAQPVYPRDAADRQVSGTVYVLLKVGRDGNVTDAVAEQVNLRVVPSNTSEMVWCRRVLADAALYAMKRDRFNLPTVGEDVNRSFWVVRIPVAFDTHVAVREAAYGQWQAYVPGPVQRPDWASGRDSLGSADAVPEGGALLADTSLDLLTPLSGG